MSLETAMVLAAGRGERLRPLTHVVAKPLVTVAGKALIDHGLDRLAAAGVATAVVNVCYRAEAIAAHLAPRTQPRVVAVREHTRLETGGGIANALEHLGPGPFYAVNSDVLWSERGEAALARLARRWAEVEAEALLLVVPRARAYGYSGRGDFHLEAGGVLRRRGAGAGAPYVFTGVQVLAPELFEHVPRGAFSLNVLYDRAAARGRLRGLVHAGAWFHVGTPLGLVKAERGLAAGAHVRR